MESVFKFDVDAQRTPAKLLSMRNKRAILCIIATLFALVIVAGMLALWSGPPPAPSPLPNPNGYLALVQASYSAQKDTPDFASLSEDGLRELVSGNSNAVQIARSGLHDKVQVPVEYSQVYMENHLHDLSNLKLLAFAFLSEGRLAEKEQRPCDAARSYLDIIQLGIECPRGGTLIDALMGFAIESMGTTPLQMLVAKLDAKCCRDIAHELETLDAQRQTRDEIVQNERYWSHRTFPGLSYRLVELFTRGSKAALANGKRHLKAKILENHKLRLSLAAHAYQLDNGHAPGSVSDLVPTYLKAIPTDPATGKNLTLSP
jgi:hypothetical protein